MLKKIISAIYIISLFIEVVFLPLSAILIILKLCGANSFSWLACCIFAVIAIAFLPFLLVSKMILDNGGKK